MVAALCHTDAEQASRFVADEVETARLRLRMFTQDDLDALCRITCDPEVMRYIGEGRPLTRDETHLNMMSIMNGFRRRGFGRWAIVKKDGGALIGYCGLSQSSEEVGVEVAYMLARDEWDKGLASEAGRAALRYGFERLGLDSVAGLALRDNFRSRRVLERLGMRYLRDGRFYGYDCVWYTIAREAWDEDGSLYRLNSKNLFSANVPSAPPAY